MTLCIKHAHKKRINILQFFMLL